MKTLRQTLHWFRCLGRAHFVAVTGALLDALFRKSPRLPCAALPGALCLLALPVHAAPGDLDPTFGTGGKVNTPYAGRSVALQSDGKIVVAGTWEFATNFLITSDFALMRYTAGGALDASFGTGGTVITDFANSNDFGSGVVVQSDGKILVAGAAFIGSNHYDFALARYTASGELDASFGAGGKVTTPIGDSSDQGLAVALQSDGKILVAGGAVLSNIYEFALVRYTDSGELDTSFGTGGKVTTPIGSTSAHIFSIAVQADGKIVVAGKASVRFALARYTASGALDTSFGTGGKLTATTGNNDDFCFGLAVDSNENLITVGYSFFFNRFFTIYDFALLRFTPGGAPDTSFGTGGKVATDFGGRNDYGLSLAVQRDGKLIVAGESSGDVALARYTATGALDASFGTGGKVITDLGSFFDRAHSVVLQGDGKILVAGATGLARYLGDPPKLNIVSSGAGQTTIAWTPVIPGFVLQETLTLSPATWTDAPSGETNPITVPITETTKFYRLYQP